MRKSITLNIGLSQREAEKRLKKYGLNRLNEGKKLSAWRIIINQFGDFMVLLLSAATLLSALMGEYVEAITVSVIILLNALLGFVQEFRTEKTMAALKRLAAPEVNVIRDGVRRKIQSEYIVPGDAVLLETGSRVPADGKLSACVDMQIDESMLTGESEPVDKCVGDCIYMGTTVVSGHGTQLVRSTGMDTAMGEIADMIDKVGAGVPATTPLQMNLDKLGKIIAIACVAICACVALLGVLRGEKMLDMLLVGISLAVAAVPEGLSAVVAVALAIGVRRMIEQNALVRRLPAVETLGCASVICSDKTGTITQNKMRVRKTFVNGSENEVGAEISDLFEVAVLASNVGENAGINPTEAAIQRAALVAGVRVENLASKYVRLAEVPFSSENKYMMTMVRREDGSVWICSKGAPDVVMNMCNKWMRYGREEAMVTTVRKQLQRANACMAREALRVLAVGYKKLTEDEVAGLCMQNSMNGINELGGINGVCRNAGPCGKNESKELASVNEGLVFMGMLGLMDPPRKEALQGVHICKKANIRVVMITGDQKRTAEAIAREVGIDENNQGALSGDEIDRLTDEQFSHAVTCNNVFSGVLPRHKLRIVQELKRQGEVVAMTGDGVNDAPAVRDADIGIAMGKSGTEVTREAADMMLTDDNFGTIAAAVAEGRLIFCNIRKFIRYLLACNFGEVLTMFVTMLLAFPLPLVPVQVLWVNLVTDGLPAIALGFDPGDSELMTMRPRRRTEGVFSGGMIFLIVGRGILIGALTVGIFIFVYLHSGDLNIARTCAFMVLVFTQLVHVFECKSETKSIFEINIFNNWGLIVSVVVSGILTFIVSSVPVLNRIFSTVPLTGFYWKVVGVFVLLFPIMGTMLTKSYSLICSLFQTLARKHNTHKKRFILPS